jgi:hypothetical protein
MKPGQIDDSFRLSARHTDAIDARHVIQVKDINIAAVVRPVGKADASLMLQQCRPSLCRNDKTSGIEVNGQPEGVYMVTSGIHANGGCCFDFGNAETNSRDDGNGHMDAIRLMCGKPCNPHVGLDMENGVYPGLPVTTGLPFVTALGANDGQKKYQVYWGNAQVGGLATTGLLPLLSKSYTPMRQEGAILLGIGGDNSNASLGSFFEGVMTAGFPSPATMNEVQTNVISVGYAAP